MDESTLKVAQGAIFIRGIDVNCNTIESLAKVVAVKCTIRRLYLYTALSTFKENYLLHIWNFRLKVKNRVLICTPI